ncbi:MAG: hypothetical protein IKO72_14005 [Kiritimatiellae bacterium]|nr:hypothetical protein [Kiritimatiellia bacterium]
MTSIENSLKYEAEVEPGKVRLVTSGEFVRVVGGGRDRCGHAGRVTLPARTARGAVPTGVVI